MDHSGSTHTLLELFSKEMSAVIADLQCLSCCPRCILRLCGERNNEVFRKSSLQDIEKMIESMLSVDNKVEANKPKVDKNEEMNNTHSSNSPLPICPSCLGLLHLCNDEDFLKKIIAAVREADYEFKKYALAVTAPLQFHVREHSILLHLQERHREIYRDVTSDDIIAAKDVFKWIFSSILALALNVSFVPLDPFEINLVCTHPETDNECEQIISEIKARSGSRPGKRRKISTPHTITRPAVMTGLSKLSTCELFRKLSKCPPLSPHTVVDCHVKCSHGPLYVAGRYNKYSRELSQTPWILDGERKGISSVEELLCDKLKDRVIAKGYNFSSSGREDIDVCTLGRGRPFVAEFIDPHRTMLSPNDMKHMQQDINGGTKYIEVRDLQIIDKEETAKLKEGEMEKTKSYSALIHIDKTIQKEDILFLKEVKDLKLYQKTPIRVLHRRPLAVRERFIHTMSADFIDKHHFRLQLCTQAGTYIKEFVHGDFGRTQPSLGSIMKSDTDILELDVEAVNVDWPKRIDD
ncbi:tRNA pseudouridine synthase Pus10-like [Glandiceps talaboti]